MHGSCEVLCRLGYCPKDKEPQMQPGGYSDSTSINQCDGCRQGLPIVNGLHMKADGHPFMACTRDRYCSPSGPPLGPNQVRIWVRDPADKGPDGFDARVWMPAVAISLDEHHNVVTAQVELDDGHMGEMENRNGLEVKVEVGPNEG